MFQFQVLYKAFLKSELILFLSMVIVGTSLGFSNYEYILFSLIFAEETIFFQCVLLTFL